MIKGLIEETQHHLAVMSQMEKKQEAGGSFDLESHLLFLKSCQMAEKNLSQIMYSIAKNTILNWQRPDDPETKTDALLGTNTSNLSRTATYVGICKFCRD